MMPFAEEGSFQDVKFREHTRHPSVVSLNLMKHVRNRNVDLDVISNIHSLKPWELMKSPRYM